MRIVVLVVALAGCATPYQAGGIRGGYSEMRLSERSFRVAFQGNGFTGEETAQRYALIRAAELATANGFAGFQLAGDRTTSENTGFVNAGNGNYLAVHKPTTSITVNMLTREEIATAPPSATVYDARMLLAQFQPAAVAAPGEPAPTQSATREPGVVYCGDPGAPC